MFEISDDDNANDKTTEAGYTIRSYKLGSGELKINLFFSNYCPLQIWTLKICNQDISKSVIASSLKLS